MYFLYVNVSNMHIYSVLTIYFSLRKHDNFGFISCILFDYLTVFFNYLQVVSIRICKTMYETNTKIVNNKLKVFKAHLTH